MKIVHGNWKNELFETAPLGKRKLRIICPFIKEQTIRDFTKACKPSSIQVITRFNLNDCYEGVSDLTALEYLLEKGAEIQGVKGLHSKLYIYGAQKAIITSANLTQSGLSSNHEFGCTISETEMVKICHEYFDGLWAHESNNLTHEKLHKWMKEVENAKLAGGVKSGPKKRKLKNYGRKAGNVNPDPSNEMPDIDLSLSSHRNNMHRNFSQAFVKFLGETNNRVMPNFDVTDQLRRSGCYWSLGYPKSRRPRQPEDGDTMFIGRLVKGTDGNDTIIFGRAFAMGHKDKRDVASSQDKAAPEQEWRDTWDKYIRVYDSEFVAGTIGNGVRLSELMDALEENAFLSTQRNAQAGEGNTNPRKAFMQSPSVQLSEEGFHWLSKRLDQQIELHGITPVESYRDFYWPKVGSSEIGAVTTFTMQPTYYDKGFFNLSVSTNPFFNISEVHGELISAKTGEKFWVNIRRDLNTSTQARIRGNVALRDYFQKHYKLGEEVQIRILDHKTLKLV